MSSSITDGAKFNSNSSYYLARDPSDQGPGDTISGNLTVTGNVAIGGTTTSTGQITANGGIAVQSGNLSVSPGASNLSAVNASGALTVVGASNLTSVVASGNLTVAGNGVIGTPSTSTSLTVNGNIVQNNTAAANTYNGQSNAFSGSISVGGGAGPGAGSITAFAYINNSISVPITIQVITAGIPTTGVTAGSSGVGNNMLALNKNTLVPGSANFKSYKVFLSGSASARYDPFFLISSGGVGGGIYQGQFQGVSGLLLNAYNYKGNVSSVGTTVGPSPGLVSIFADNVIVCPADLTNNTLFYCGSPGGPIIVATNDPGVNIWLHFVPIL
jgi:hypothetical protein